MADSRLNNVSNEVDDRLQKIIDQGLKLEGLYRHASTHASGVVISDENLQSIIPLYKDVKVNGSSVVEFKNSR